MINSELLSLLRRESKLFHSLHHGLPHWKTVERNGLYLAQFTGADKKVVCYFAYFHDCMRENEYTDPEHGPRAAKFIKKLDGKLGLNNEQLDLLHHAVSGHTHGKKTKDATIYTCWDADRLDIGRVGVAPLSRYMISDEAKRIVDEDDEQVLLKYGFIDEIF